MGAVSDGRVMCGNWSGARANDQCRVLGDPGPGWRRASGATPPPWRAHPLKNGRRSRAAWPLVRRCGRWHAYWDGRRRRSAARLVVMEGLLDIARARRRSPETHAATRWCSMRASRSPRMSRCTSATRRVRGNAAPTRTPTGCSGSTSRTAPISRATPNEISTASRGNSTPDLAKPSASAAIFAEGVARTG